MEDTEDSNNQMKNWLLATGWRMPCRGGCPQHRAEDGLLRGVVVTDETPSQKGLQGLLAVSFPESVVTSCSRVGGAGAQCRAPTRSWAPIPGPFPGFRPPSPCCTLLAHRLLTADLVLQAGLTILIHLEVQPSS